MRSSWLSLVAWNEKTIPPKGFSASRNNCNSSKPTTPGESPAAGESSNHRSHTSVRARRPGRPRVFVRNSHRSPRSRSVRLFTALRLPSTNSRNRPRGSQRTDTETRSEANDSRPHLSLNLLCVSVSPSVIPVDGIRHLAPSLVNRPRHTHRRVQPRDHLARHEAFVVV